MIKRNFEIDSSRLVATLEMPRDVQAIPVEVTIAYKRKFTFPSGTVLLGDPTRETREKCELGSRECSAIVEENDTRELCLQCPHPECPFLEE